MLRLGVMGGTFDPIHLAHLIAAEEARAQLSLDEVLFIPAGRPPHKTSYSVSDAEHRYAMALLATASNPAFRVSRMEIERTGPSYTVDTIGQIRGMCGSDTEIYFIMGADEALDLSTWYEAERLPQLAHFLVVPRPGFDMSDLRARVPECFHTALTELRMPLIDISATEVRARAASGRSLTYLVPAPVEAYIRKYGLYPDHTDQHSSRR